MTETGILASILAVFAEIGEWMVTNIPTFFALFYSNGLTLLGTLAVCSLGIGIVFLLIGVIQKFLRFRA